MTLIRKHGRWFAAAGVALALLAALALVTSQAEAGGTKHPVFKVTICHNGETIRVPIHKAFGHKHHDGDYLGECRQEPTPEPTPTEEPTPEPTEEPTPEPTEEPTPEPTETPEPTPSVTPTPEPTPEDDDPEDIETPTPTPSVTPEPTEEPTPTATTGPAQSVETMCIGEDLHVLLFQDGALVETTIIGGAEECSVIPQSPQTPQEPPQSPQPTIRTDTPPAPTPADTGHGVQRAGNIGEWWPLLAGITLLGAVVGVSRQATRR